jgi:hypothetical protein
MVWTCYKTKRTKNNTKVINKKLGNTRPTGRPRTRWIGGILEVLGNITPEKVKRRAKDHNVPLPSTLKRN